MFTKRRKGAVLVTSLLWVFIFTLTSSVVFNPTTVWAETSEVSEGVEDESSGVVESVGGFFSGIINWINSVTNAVNKMWGMENGSGMAMVVNAAFYVLLVVGVLFFGKMIINIINDMINRGVDEKYEKPSFRKK